ncbi:MAG TPA: polysaccharide biosynthesis/export family protein [Bryobacteraceae bacterium]|nr:polysaccharide biosynthesis/export family protein [Bryobacteraceae bacterium]
MTKIWLVIALTSAVFAQAPRPIAAYVAGPGDQIQISAPETGELFAKPVSIGANGSLTLPLIGRIQAKGMTVEQLEAELNERLKNFFHDPLASVTVVDFQSQPVSVVGAVAEPGVFQLRGGKTLSEVLSMAGGPRETAGAIITIARRGEHGTIPVAGATADPARNISTVELDLQEILTGKDPGGNIDIRPYDLISISQANSNVVYVVGDVQRAGSYTLGTQRGTSVLKALSLAGGLGRTARGKKARILRTVPGRLERLQIAINIDRILAGKAEDIGLRPEDIVIIPTSSRKTFTTVFLPATVAAGVAALIYAGASH